MLPERIAEELDSQTVLRQKLQTLQRWLTASLPVVDSVALIERMSGDGRLCVLSESGQGEFRDELVELCAGAALHQAAGAPAPQALAGSDLGRTVEAEGRPQAALRSAWVVPCRQRKAILGLLLIGSTAAGAFDRLARLRLQAWSPGLEQFAADEISALRVLDSSVDVARHMTGCCDQVTQAHNERTSVYARIIAERMGRAAGLDEWQIHAVGRFAPLHDLGKIAVPDTVIHKPDLLDEGEWAMIRSHCEKGAEMIGGVLHAMGADSLEHSRMVRNIVLHHHEAVDGSGYPRGLTECCIPVEARIVAVADVFDALTTPRAYKAAWSVGSALSAMDRLKGVKLDGECVNALMRERPEVEHAHGGFMGAPPAY